MKKNTLKTVLISTLTSAMAVCSLLGVGLTTAAADETPDKLVITMTDEYEDSWNDAAIQVYEDGVCTDTVTMDNETSVQEWSTDYDATKNYAFKWVEGMYDDECSFTVSVAGEEVFSVSDCTDFFTGEIVFRHEAACAHDFDENLLCGICNKTCGVEIFHDVDDKTCNICHFTCGVSLPHAWVKGVCEVCQEVCEHEEMTDGTCNVCAYSYPINLIAEDGSITSYFTMESVVEVLSEYSNPTIQLQDDILTTSVYFSAPINGVLTIDLNGYTWSLDGGLFIPNDLHAIITDTSDAKTGGMISRGDNTIHVIDNATLEVVSGRIESVNHSAIYTGHGGSATNSTLIVSGGVIVGHHSITAQGQSVTITGGTFVGGSDEISWASGSLDLSGHANPSGLEIYLYTDIDVSAITLTLPTDFHATYDDEELKAGDTYTIYHTNCTYTLACDAICSVCKQETRPSRHEGGTATCHERAVCEICSQPYGYTSGNHTMVDGVCNVCDQETLIVATLKDGSTKEFISLEEAFRTLERAQLDASLQLNGDAALDGEWFLLNDYALDLNGYSITCQPIAVYGTWSVEDSSEEQTGKMIAEKDDIFHVKGTMTIHGGTFDGAFAVWSIQPTEDKTGIKIASLVIYDGTFIGDYGIDIFENGTVIVYNATFDTEDITFSIGDVETSTFIFHNAKFPNGGGACWWDAENGEENLIALDKLLAPCANVYDTQGNVLTMEDGLASEEAFEIKSTHNFGDWTKTKDATVLEEGEEERICGDCQTKETREIPKLEPPKESDCSTGSTNDEDSQKKGCGGVIDGVSVSVCLLGIAAISLKKRKETN